MTFSQFLSILKARWLSALLVLVLTVGTTVGVSLLLPKNYTASAAVVLDVRSPDPIAGMVLGAMAMPAYMATQVDIIQSDRVAQRVVQGLRMTENAQTRQQWLEATEGKGSFDAWLADNIKKKLDVKPSRESNVININYTNPDPRAAAAIANAFVRAYMDISIGLRISPAKQYNEFFDARSKELREGVEKAQAKLSDYQKTHGILATDERFDIENQRLNELNSQLVALQALSAESTSRQAQAKTSADQLHDVINNPVVAGLRADQSRQEARLQELSARLGDAHPQVVELKANIAELRSRLETETRRVSGSVGVTNTINKQREAEIRASLEAQRSKVLALKQQRDEVVVLQREVETAQRSYDQVVQRLSQTNLESQNTQTNISVLTPASEPADHSSPKILLNTLLSVFLGTLLAVGFALVRELMDRRVRSLDDLSEGLGLPVLGSLPRPMRGARGAGPLLLPSNVMARLPSPGR
ncbi:MAG: chain length determinant protein EpsF [Burkholderiales bacterium]|jgi:succinoglycan biosynthesis transport protein ExoP|nr:chain length determinant protein EpsF [Burkholderiales bacterium]MBP7521799.1 chain length determinant protein EpsF [Leptothrix sp. (in: b-proteobacteria)]HQY08342.1 chain length determinant protein EpsF [Burkholderiaceae bacterium]